MTPKFSLNSKGEFAGNDNNCSTRDLLDTKNTSTQNVKQDIVKSDGIRHGDDSKKVREDNNLSKIPSEHKFKIRWFMVYACIYLYSAGTYGLYLMYTKATWFTFVFTHFMTFYVGFGVTAGAHRLWAHKSYKAKLPLRILLMLAQTTAHQNSIYGWVRDHRIHHKFTDTDADPYNAKRGFFFSHIGWILTEKHPLVIEKGQIIDMEDLKQDPVVMFQKKHFLNLMYVLCFVIPTLIPIWIAGEPLYISWNACVFRYIWTLNTTWSVNSFAHLWGMKPYNKFSTAVQNKVVCWLALGEGWHNYHHVFPWDYKTAELGNYSLNYTKFVIDFFAKIGWAYDMKTVPEEIVRRRFLKTGDNSHEYCKTHNKCESDANRNYIDNLEDDQSNDENDDHGDYIWGWDDKDIRPQDKMNVVVLNKREG